MVDYIVLVMAEFGELFDFLYSVGSQQQRDQQGNVLSTKSQNKKKGVGADGKPVTAQYALKAVLYTAEHMSRSCNSYLCHISLLYLFSFNRL